MEESKPIGGGLAFVLIALAAVTDTLQALLTFILIGVVLNPIIDVMIAMLFTILLAAHGGGLVKRRAISMVITTIGEIIPGLNALPLWTGFAIYTVVVDKLHHNMQEDPYDGRRPPTSRTWRL